MDRPGTEPAIAPGRPLQRRSRRPTVWAAAGLAVVCAVGWTATLWRAAALRGRAEAAARSERWSDVETALARCAWYGRLDNDAWRLRAEAAQRRGDPVTAARWLRATTPDHPRAAADRLRAGALLLGAFHLGAAESAYRSALAIDGRSEEALRALIVIYGIEKRGREQEATLWALHEMGDRATRIEALRLLAPGVPVIPPDSLPKGIDEAELLRRAREADQRDAWATIALADLLRSRGEMDAARGLLSGKPVVEDDRPWHAAWDTARVRLELDEGRDVEVESWMDARAGVFAEQPGWLALVGEWKAEQGRFVEAEAAFRAAARLDPRDPRHRYRLARALRSAGEPEGADREEAAFRAAEQLKALASEIDEEAPDPVLMARAAELCEAAGRPREAQAWRNLAHRAGPAAKSGPR